MAEPTTDEKPTTEATVEEEYQDPNTPWSPEESDETNQLTLEQIEELRSQLPVIQDIIDWFDKQIAAYSNPEIISGVNPSSKAEDVKKAVLFAQQMIQDYKEKRKQFTSQFAEYLNPESPPQE